MQTLSYAFAVGAFAALLAGMPWSTIVCVIFAAKCWRKAHTWILVEGE